MTSLSETARRLQGADLFAGLDPPQLEALAKQAVTETLPRRRSLFMAGDEADGLRIVVSGLLRVWINDADGREVTLNLVEPGEALG